MIGGTRKAVAQSSRAAGESLAERIATTIHALRASIPLSRTFAFSAKTFAKNEEPQRKHLATCVCRLVSTRTPQIFGSVLLCAEWRCEKRCHRGNTQGRGRIAWGQRFDSACASWPVARPLHRNENRWWPSVTPPKGFRASRHRAGLSVHRHSLV